MSVAHLDELDAVEMPDGFVWRPVRRRFGIRALGVNAYTVREAGAQIIEEHSESGGQQEIYLVVRGRARFTVDGNEHELGPGQLVFVRDPSLRRAAVALDGDTLVLAMGGTPGEAHEVSDWEAMFYCDWLNREGRHEEAIAAAEEALGERPGRAPLLYNLACAEALGGRHADALVHLARAVELDRKWAAHARRDSDLDAIRREPGFPA